MSAITASPTLDLVIDQLEERKELTSSPYKKRALTIRQFLFRCMGADGFGMRSRGVNISRKSNFILYTSNALSGLATIGLTALTCGYHGYVQYKGSEMDRNRVTELRPVVCG